MLKEVKQAYSKRASEYVAALGSIESMDPLDIALITDWGKNVNGAILDVGSGPGHWTELLHSQGRQVRGIDMVPGFVESARQRFPLCTFEVGNLLDLPFGDSSFDGILAWYSLIHIQPEALGAAFKELARVLKQEGVLLVGGFLGSQNTPFNHAVTEAFYWSEGGLAEHLESAGFQVSSTYTRRSEKSRAHVAVHARLL